ncbi:MAG: SHOCT domain-containing protein [Actinomycetota bacterium]|nr:SHOCT domain-containing protein [Actinomycetota bacterium]
MFMGFFWLLFLILIIIAVAYLGQSKAGGESNTSYFSQKEEPLEVAKIRYAKGEISKDEFEQMKKDLQD